MDKNTVLDLVSYAHNDYYFDLSNVERQIIFAYSNNLYKVLNYNLRNNKESGSCLLLDSALNKFEFNKPIKVYRKLNIKYNLIDYIKSLDKGFIIDKAFQSTSLSLDGFDGSYNVLLDIEINNPSSGAYIAPFCMLKDEYEFLLKRNTRLDIEDYILTNGVYNVKAKIK